MSIQCQQQIAIWGLLYNHDEPHASPHIEKKESSFIEGKKKLRG